MMIIDLLIHSAAQLVTCYSPDGPKREAAMQDAGLIHDGAVAVHEGRILAAGDSDGLRERYRGRENIDASGKVVCPGFVDPHTHVVYAGDRVDEFELRVRAPPTWRSWPPAGASPALWPPPARPAWPI